MQVLLINQNATIERLVKLSSGKQGYGLALAHDISEVVNAAYDFVVIDSDLYQEDGFGLLRQKLNAAKTILIVSKGALRASGFDIYIEKPFLPTELLDAFSTLEKIIAQNPAPVKSADIEEDIFADNIASFANFDDKDGDELISMDDHDIFGNITDDTKDEFGSLDDFDLDAEIGFDDSDEIEFEESKQPANSFDDIDSIEFEESKQPTDSFDEDDELEFNFGEEEDDNVGDDASFIVDEEDSIDDFKLEVDEDADDGLDDFDFSLSEDDLLDNKQVGTTLASEEVDGFDDLDTQEEIEKHEADEEEFDMSEFENSESTSMVFDNEDTELKIEDKYEDMLEEDVNPFAVSGDAHMFEQDEVNKLKNLLDETGDGEIDNDDFDLENVKIFNDELGSLTEESLAEALGVSVKEEQSANAAQHEIENITENVPLQPLPQMPKAPLNEQQMSPAPVDNAIQLTPNQSVTLSLEALKELLNIADITINITLTKKQ